jgi:hypothetical protein
MSVEISRARRAALDYRAVREVLLRKYPELVEDEDALLDTLQGCTDLDECIEAIVRSAKEDETLSETLAVTIAKNRERKGRFERRAESKKRAAFELMSENQIKKIEAAEFTVSRRAVPQSVIITNEHLIPDRLSRITREPNKTAIKQALVNGEDVPGAELSNGGETISIRTT